MNPIFLEKGALIDEMLRREPQHRFLSPEDCDAFGEYAWDKGLRTAGRIAQEYPGQMPEGIVTKMGVKILDRDGPGFYFSEYSPSKKEIILFANTIQSGFLAPEAEHLKNADYQRVRPLFLAHELFHHLECTDSAVGLTCRERKVTVFSLGPFRWRTGLRSLSEIAAHSFALCLAGEGILR